MLVLVIQVLLLRPLTDYVQGFQPPPPQPLRRRAFSHVVATKIPLWFMVNNNSKKKKNNLLQHQQNHRQARLALHDSEVNRESRDTIVDMSTLTQTILLNGSSTAANHTTTRVSSHSDDSGAHQQHLITAGLVGLELDDTDEADVPMPTQNGGYSHTKASRAKISAANKGNTPWNKGQQRSAEVKARIAAGVRAANRQRFLQKLLELNMTEAQYEAEQAARLLAVQAVAFDPRKKRGAKFRAF
jgi:NUMOD3 motif